VVDIAKYREELKKMPLEFKKWKKDKLIEFILSGMEVMGDDLINRINKAYQSPSNFSPIVLFVCNHISLLSGSNQIVNDGITSMVLEMLEGDILKAEKVERSLIAAINKITEAQKSIPTKTVTEVWSQKEAINSLDNIIGELELIKDEQISIRYGCEEQKKKQFHFIAVFVGRVSEDLLDLNIKPVKSKLAIGEAAPIVRYINYLLKILNIESEEQLIYSSQDAIYSFFHRRTKNRPNFYFGKRKG